MDSRGVVTKLAMSHIKCYVIINRLTCLPYLQRRFRQEIEDNPVLYLQEFESLNFSDQSKKYAQKIEGTQVLVVSLLNISRF